MCGISHHLRSDHRQVDEEVVVGVDKAQHRGDVGSRRIAFDQVGCDLAIEERCRGLVAIVTLVAHLQCLGDDVPQVDAATPLERSAHQRRQHCTDPAQPVDDFGRVGSHPHHLTDAFVEVGVGAVLTAGIDRDVHRHGRRDHTGHRTDRTVLVVGSEFDVAGFEFADRLFRRGGETFEQHATDQRST